MIQRGALLLVAGFCYGLFVWAGACFFRVPDAGAASNKRTVAMLGLVAIAGSMWGIAKPAEGGWRSDSLAGVCFLASVAVLAWCLACWRSSPPDFAGSTRAPEAIMQRGPYRWVRHPIYLSYLLGWLAGLLGSGRLWLLVPYGALASLYVASARREEEAILGSALADEYRAYRERAGFLLPRILRTRS